MSCRANRPFRAEDAECDWQRLAKARGEQECEQLGLVAYLGDGHETGRYETLPLACVCTKETHRINYLNVAVSAPWCVHRAMYLKSRSIRSAPDFVHL